MRILSVVIYGYYHSKSIIEPMRLYLTVPLVSMGHDVDTFNHKETYRQLGKEKCTELLVNQIKTGNYDLVLYQTSGHEPIIITALKDLSQKTCIVAWNSDDDWQWEHTSSIAENFTYMVTTYPRVYRENKATYPNLRLSQWGCLGIFSDRSRPKDIDFSFAGSVYRTRNAACRYLKHKADLKVFGKGARLVELGLPYLRGAFRIPLVSGGPISFQNINDVWNRTKVSYTPMAGGSQGQVLSLKSRAFDMGLSGTLMLCEHSPDLEMYYAPGKECVTFETLEDCAEKANWYLTHETERLRIATNYYQRTLKDHLWTHRFTEMFTELGL